MKGKDEIYQSIIDISNINNVSELKAILDAVKDIDEANERERLRLIKIPKIIEFDETLEEKYNFRVTDRYPKTYNSRDVTQLKANDYEDSEIQRYLNLLIEADMCADIIYRVNYTIHKLLFGNQLKLKIWDGTKSDFARFVSDEYLSHKKDYKSLRAATVELYSQYEWQGKWEFSLCYDLVRKI